MIEWVNVRGFMEENPDETKVLLGQIKNKPVWCNRSVNFRYGRHTIFIFNLFFLLTEMPFKMHQIFFQKPEKNPRFHQ